MKMKIVIGCVFALSLFAGFRIFYHEGIVGQTKKPLQQPVFAVKGCFCHGDTASPNVRVWINGPDSVAAGTQALYKLSVAKNANIAAGFDVAAFYGALGVYDSLGTQLMRVDPSNPVDSLELTHLLPRLSHGRDTISWSFWYRAPLTIGILDTIYANGNSVDTNQDPSGDEWNYANNFHVRVIGPNSVADEPTVATFRLSQNYPNPFNPATIIRYEIPATSHVELKVFDLAGRTVETLVNADQLSGIHEATFGRFNANQLATGIYLYRLIVRGSAGRDYSAVKKMIFLK